MTVRINKQKINLREKLAGAEDKVNFDEVVRGLGEYGGNVGIGVTDPVNALHVHGQVDGLGYIRITDRSTGSSYADGVRIGYNALGLRIQNYENTNISFFTNGSTEALTIKNDGNVGIGTTDPNAKLDIETTSQTSDTILNLSWQHLNTTTQIEQRIGWSFGDDATISKPGETAYIAAGKHGTFGVQQQRQSYLSFATENGIQQQQFGGIEPNYTPVERMRINAAGNVGIGTTSPGSYKLNVNGATFCTSGTWSGSDDRVKHNEQPIVGALETLSKITPKKYIKTTEMYDADHDFELDADGNPVDENGEPVEHRVEAGVIAQQVLTVDELTFAVSPEGIDQDGTVTSPHGLDYNSLFTYAIAAIQEQQTIINDLKSRIETLEQQ